MIFSKISLMLTLPIQL